MILIDSIPCNYVNIWWTIFTHFCFEGSWFGNFKPNPLFLKKTKPNLNQFSGENLSMKISCVFFLMLCLPLLASALRREELEQFLLVDNGGSDPYCRSLRMEQRRSNRNGLKIEFTTNSVPNHLAGQVGNHKLYDWTSCAMFSKFYIETSSYNWIK